MHAVAAAAASIVGALRSCATSPTCCDETSRSRKFSESSCADEPSAVTTLSRGTKLDEPPSAKKGAAAQKA
eukprot:6081414-Prymnesium_polylepis.1